MLLEHARTLPSSEQQTRLIGSLFVWRLSLVFSVRFVGWPRLTFAGGVVGRPRGVCRCRINTHENAVVFGGPRAHLEWFGGPVFDRGLLVLNHHTMPASGAGSLFVAWS